MQKYGPYAETTKTRVFAKIVFADDEMSSLNSSRKYKFSLLFSLF